PTGSGKTTTAYAALKHIHKKEKNVITIEDPVEYQMIGVNQIQTNAKIGLTFATALRNILRQDPDIILVGEIRDKETAEIAIHAALTGHLVISTLHTNDAISTIARLVDMGIEPYLIASSITGIISQRLLRKICPYCKRDYQPSVSILNEFKLPVDTKFYRGSGCIRCRNTGYIDRIGIYELLVISEITKNLIIRKSEHNVILAHAMKEGFVPLKQAGIKLVCEGITTFEELIAITHEEVV
ncbi:MAG: ATPase, T2SS/T4P/T4SS family, partial [Thermodesulfobacteriaceae bacterium]|nr:ATPase, T2SS/T4P/T4SS family [Thermodesulfobacteriaceae bacterium]